MKEYIINISGVVIPEDEWETTTIYKVDTSTGDWAELYFDKSDIVKIEEERNNIWNYLLMNKEPS